MTKDVVFRRDTLALDNVRVEEVQDFVIIPDCVLTREGVFNDAYRAREDLARSWSTLDGKPIVLHHPPEDDAHHGLLAFYPDEIHGFATNVRYDDATGAITYDAYLPVTTTAPGLIVPESIAAFNRDLAAAIKAGARVDNSGGYLTRVTREQGTWNGRDYVERRRDFAWWHVAIVPEGACGWGDACGMARAQHADHARPKSLSKAKAPATPAGDAAQSKQEGDGEVMTKPNENPAGQDPANPPAPRATGVDAVIEERLRRAEEKAIKLDTLEVQLKELVDRQKRADDARLRGKRDELAKLRAYKQDSEDRKGLDSYCEGALDREIAREQELARKRGARADDLAFGGDAGTEEPAAFAPTIGAFDARKGEWTHGIEARSAKGAN